MIAQLADARQRERALIERALDVVCTLDGTGCFVFLSPSSERAWGYRSDDLIKQSVRQILSEKSFLRLMSYAQTAEKSVERVSFETDILCRDGSIKHATWRGHWSISDKTLFCIVHDMTEQKLVEQALRASEERLKEILELLPAGVLIASSTNVVEFANAASRRLLHCPSQRAGREQPDSEQASQIIGKSTATIFTPPPAWQHRLESHDMVAHLCDGSQLNVEVHSERIELSGAVKELLVFIDKSALYEVEKTKQDFFAMVAHDLSAPLTALKGLVVLIEEGVLDRQSEHGTRVTDSVNQECSQLLRLVKDMVDLGKMGTNSFRLNKEAGVCAADVVQSAIDGVQTIAQKKQITVAVEHASSSYCGDSHRVKQVLTNLLTNAINFSPTGGQILVQAGLDSNTHTNVDQTEPERKDIKLDCKICGLAFDKRCVRFSVKDFGTGIPADKLDRVFEKYEQVSPAGGSNREGTGLGLAICKMIVQHHGGQIGVESVEGEGSLFWFTIPAHHSVDESSSPL